MALVWFIIGFLNLNSDLEQCLTADRVFQFQVGLEQVFHLEHGFRDGVLAWRRFLKLVSSQRTMLA